MAGLAARLVLLTWAATCAVTTSAAWFLADPSESCSSRCTALGKTCNTEDFHAHAGEMDSALEIDEIVGGSGLSCSSHTVGLATQLNTPYYNSDGTCSMLGEDVQLSSITCDSAPSFKEANCDCRSPNGVSDAYRDGATPNDANLCMQKANDAIRPCYKYTGQCSSELTKCRSVDQQKRRICWCSSTTTGILTQTSNSTIATSTTTISFPHTTNSSTNITTTTDTTTDTTTTTSNTSMLTSTANESPPKRDITNVTTSTTASSTATSSNPNTNESPMHRDFTTNATTTTTTNSSTTIPISTTGGLANRKTTINTTTATTTTSTIGTVISTTTDSPENIRIITDTTTTATTRTTATDSSTSTDSPGRRDIITSTTISTTSSTATMSIKVDVEKTLILGSTTTTTSRSTMQQKHPDATLLTTATAPAAVTTSDAVTSASVSTATPPFTPASSSATTSTRAVKATQTMTITASIASSTSMVKSTITDTTTFTTTMISSSSKFLSVMRSSETTTLVKSTASTSFLGVSSGMAAVQDDEQRLIASAHAHEDSIVQMLRNQTNMTSKIEHSNGDHVILVAQLQADTLSDANGSFDFSVTGSDVQVSIPVLVASTGGGAAVVIGVFGNDSIPVSAPADASLVGPALNIRLVELSTGIKIPGTDHLVEPISFRLMKDRPSGAKCSFWNETARQWSTAGVQTLDHPSGEFWCSTMHLTLFAAIIGDEAVKLVKCANVNLLQKESLQNIARGDWWSSAAAIVFWVLLLLQALVLVHSCWRSKVITVFEDADFLTSDEVYRPKPSFLTKCYSHACSRCRPTKVEKATLQAEKSEAESWSHVDRSEPMKPPKFADKVLDHLVSICARPILAWENHIVAGDMGKLGKQDLQRLKSFMADSTKKSRWSLSSSRSVIMSRSASKLHLHNAPFSQQFCMIYSQMQPWTKLLQVSVTTSPFIQALLLTSKLLGSLMFGALFLLFEDEALSHQSSELCSKSQGIKGRILRNIYLGLISLVCGTMPLLFLYKLQRRRFVYRESWSATRMRKWYMWCFRFKSFLVILLCMLHCSFSIVFVLSFLANVQASAAHQWLIRTVTIILQEMFGSPLTVALLYSAVLNVMRRVKPHVLDRVQEKFRSPDTTPVSVASKHNNTVSFTDFDMRTATSPCKFKGSPMLDLEAGAHQPSTWWQEIASSNENIIVEAFKVEHEELTSGSESEYEPEGEPAADAESYSASSVDVSFPTFSSLLREAATAETVSDLNKVSSEPPQDIAGYLLQDVGDTSVDLVWLVSQPLQDMAAGAEPLSPEAWSGERAKQLGHRSSSHVSMEALTSDTSPAPLSVAPPEPPLFPGEIR